jgi:site-specific DNA-methyltransferase (adenine-specific)
MAMAEITLLNMDCLEYMRGLPDKAFDLCIVDPPYGLNMAKERPRKDGRFAHNVPRTWDEKIPDAEYFSELKRVSHEQIIWGGNYFPLPPTQGFIFWYKQNPVDNFSDGELAWTSFSRPAKCFNFKYYGNLEGNTSASEKIHISQKPVALYEWLLTNYAKPGQRILDTHLGSGSSAIAAHNLGFEFVGTELDADYYAAAVRRFEAHKAQQTLFQPDDYDRVTRDYQEGLAL